MKKLLTLTSILMLVSFNLFAGSKAKRICSTTVDGNKMSKCSDQHPEAYAKDSSGYKDCKCDGKKKSDTPTSTASSTPAGGEHCSIDRVEGKNIASSEEAAKASANAKVNKK